MTNPELLKLRDALVKAIQPNDNALGDWKAKVHGEGPEWMILGPRYATRASRVVLAVTKVDGFTPEESKRNNQAVAEFVVTAVNLLLAKCRDRMCKADRSGVGGNTPQECDWPCCGCDPHADKVIEALEEQGKLRE